MGSLLRVGRVICVLYERNTFIEFTRIFFLRGPVLNASTVYSVPSETKGAFGIGGRVYVLEARESTSVCSSFFWGGGCLFSGCWGVMQPRDTDTNQTSQKRNANLANVVLSTHRQHFVLETFPYQREGFE